MRVEATQLTGLKHRIPSLDGLRAISISMVLISHSAILLAQSAQPHSFRVRVLYLFNLGHLGVMVFFVISGFLITTLLLKEERINLLKFYFRRTLRIFPPFYTFLLAVIIFKVLGFFDMTWGTIASALTYTSNYCCGGSDSFYLAHSWSLSVEEQFYLVWPATLLLLGTRRGLYVAGAVLIICPLIRLYYVNVDPNTQTEFHRFEGVADSISIGCLLAGLRTWLHCQDWYQRLLRLAGFYPFLAIVITLLGHHPAYFPISIYVATLISGRNVCIVLFLDWCLTKYESKTGRVLNSRPMVFIGVISYSIYLWQEPFFASTFNIPLPARFGLIATFALASYYLVERPSLQLRQYLERRNKSVRQPA
jgi:peptidoglycan/LPS O-acetylase OafA/YrhL